MRREKRIIRILIILAVGFLALVFELTLLQRKLIYHPTHHNETNGFSEWRHDGKIIGYAREVHSPNCIWLLLHGNAGQASDRDYAMSSFSKSDSVYILEYPGYGSREGSPSMEAFNSAGKEAYGILRLRFPNKCVGVVGESIGTGPASVLATNPHPPDKIVLIVPFDIFSRVAAAHYPFIPVDLILKDNWNNIDSLRGYTGSIEIFGASQDEIIPIAHAKALADSKPSSKFHEIDGGHNDWSTTGSVRITCP